MVGPRITVSLSVFCFICIPLNSGPRDVVTTFKVRNQRLCNTGRLQIFCFAMFCNISMDNETVLWNSMGNFNLRQFLSQFQNCFSEPRSKWSFYRSSTLNYPTKSAETNWKSQKSHRFFTVKSFFFAFNVIYHRTSESIRQLFLSFRVVQILLSHELQKTYAKHSTKGFKCI